MDFQNLLRELSHKEFNKNSIYALLSRIDETYNISQILPKIYSLMEKKILAKDLVYLSLLANNNLKVVQDFIDYERNNFLLEINSPSSIFDYCIFKNKHWILEVINGDLNVTKLRLAKDVINHFNILNLMKISNDLEIDIDKINTKLQCIDTSIENTFLKYYFGELRRVLNVINFCKTYSTSTDNDIYKYACQNSLLATFSNFLNLKSIDVCEEIYSFLRNSEHEDPNASEETNILAAYILLLKLLKCLQLCKELVDDVVKDKDEITELLQEIKNGIIAIDKLSLQVEMLENIFVLLFLVKDVDQSDNNESTFYCTQREVRLILTLLKTLLDELRLKNVHKETVEYKRFCDLHKFVTDGLWRLNIVCTPEVKVHNNIVFYMLAPSTSLIYLCLKQKDFDKAAQVVQIFSLEGANVVEIENHELVSDAIEAIKRNEKKDKKAAVSTASICDKLLNLKRQFEHEYAEYPWLNSKLIDTVDVVLTQRIRYAHTLELLQLTADSAGVPFLQDLAKVYLEVNKNGAHCIPDILIDPTIELNVTKYNETLQLHADIAHHYEAFMREHELVKFGTLNPNHVAHKTFLTLQELCTKFECGNAAERVRYMQRLLNYLKAYSQIFFIGGNHSAVIAAGRNTSYFRILDFTTSDILALLLFEKKVDITDFESFFHRMKLDLMYHLAGIFFPNIILKSHAIKCIQLGSVYRPTLEILAYIRKRNWLLAFILNEIYAVEENASETRTALFRNFIKLNRIEKLKVVFGDNRVVAGLQHKIEPDVMQTFMNQFIHNSLDVEHQLLLESHNSVDSLETGTEIFEGDLKTTNWKYLFDVIDSIPQNVLYESRELLELRDTIITNLVGENFEPDHFKYVQHIHDQRVRCDCILNNFTTWPGVFCIDILNAELSNFNGIDEEFKEKFSAWLIKIELYEKIRTIIEANCWFDIYLMCQNNVEEVLQRLLNTVEVDLLLNLINTHEVKQEMLAMIDTHYFVTLLESNVVYSKIVELLSKMHPTHVEPLCFTSLKLLKKLEYLQFVLEVLHQFGETHFLKNLKLSVKILACFEPHDQEHLWSLIGDPLSIIEVLIMNTRLEKLGQVLEKILPDICNCELEGEDREVTIEKIDALLQTYAEKSLEFRVILQPPARIIRTPDSGKLLQSLDSLQLTPPPRSFLMPIDVPDKIEWIQNHEVTECMCCQRVVFSMFNRRHHCRRCGRIICGGCSQKRMKVLSYGDILVRVCRDCHEQSHTEGTSSSKSETSSKQVWTDIWLLTDDPHHNYIVREEFSYEHAPSVSLCLAILKYHSRTEAYPRFILSQCETMLKMLRSPNPNGVQEIDFSLVIQMLQSLAVAAKMISAQCMLHWGTALADRILSQSDILGLLAGRGCLELIPSPTHEQSYFIDAASLRRLRDKLLENEQWSLALEVSTKAGLDNTGVFVAWGKSCLKAGSLQMAREKFQRCLDKSYYEASLDLSDSNASGVSRLLRPKLSAIAENKPAKNPSLLDEIIRILESNVGNIDPKVLKEVKTAKPTSSSMWSLSSSVSAVLQNDTAICVLNKLRNLDKIMAGNYSSFVESLSTKQSRPRKERSYLHSVFYEECVFYLKKYGSQLSLVEFYIRHNHFENALRYIHENRLSNELFVEIYNLCLKKNVITSFQEAMSKIDSTLDMWKDYLKHICRCFEEQSKLHCLYQLQQYMGDYVRAAMTCIKFYRDGAKTFAELSSREHFLHKAQEHLRQELEQEQWIEVASVQSANSQESFEAKAITNPSLVMKIDSRNINRHIHTISRQIEITAFLADYERSGCNVVELIPDISPPIDEEKPAQPIRLPTLFGTNHEKIQLAVLAIAGGDNLYNGFKIALRIIQDCALNPVKIYCQAGKQMAKREDYTGIAQLVSYIKSSGLSTSAIADVCDEMLMLSVQTLIKANLIGPQLDGLIRLISDRNMKISAYIEAKQLKSAYLLAVKHKKTSDIRRILREAEFLNQPNIKILCQKILQTHSQSPSRFKD